MIMITLIKKNDVNYDSNNIHNKYTSILMLILILINVTAIIFLIMIIVTIK